MIKKLLLYINDRNEYYWDVLDNIKFKYTKSNILLLLGYLSFLSQLLFDTLSFKVTIRIALKLNRFSRITEF